MASPANASRDEAVRLLALCLRNSESAQSLLKSPTWQSQLARQANAALEAATNELTQAIRHAKKAEKEVLATEREAVEAEARREREAKMRTAKLEKDAAEAAARQAKDLADAEEAEKRLAAKKAKQVAEEAEAERKAVAKREKEQQEAALAEERARIKAEQDAERAAAASEAAAAKAAAAKDRVAEERRQRALRDAAEAERKAAARREKEQREADEFEKRAKRLAEQEAEREMLRIERDKASEASAAEKEASKAEKARARQEAAVHKMTAEKQHLDERRSSAAAVANQRLERSNKRVHNFLPPEGPSTTLDIGDGDAHEVKDVGPRNAAMRGIAIDQRAAELLMNKMAEKRQQVRMREAPAWFKSWKQHGGARAAEMEADVGFTGDCMALGGNGGDAICCAGGGGDPKLVGTYSASNGMLLRTMAGHTDVVICVAAIGDRIVSGGRDKTLRIWSADTGECSATLAGSEDALFGLSLSGDRILSSEKGGKARLWSASSKRCLAVYAEHTGATWSAALSDELAITGSHDKTARIWPITNVSGSTPSASVLPHPEPVFSVTMAGDTLATACGDRRVRVWSLSTLICTHTLEHIGASDTMPGAVEDFREGLFPFAVHLASDCALVSGGGPAKTIKIWSLHGSVECIATLEHKATVRGVVASTSGFVASAGGKLKQLVVWRPKGK